MRYAVVIEKGKKNYGVYVPDVPGCVSVGDTAEESLANIREALRTHFRGIREDGDQIPDPVSLVDYVEVSVSPSLAAASASTESRPIAKPRTGNSTAKVGRRAGNGSPIYKPSCGWKSKR